MKITRQAGSGAINLDKLIKEVGSKVGKVGWFKDSKYPETNMPVATVAAIQENGAPSRSIPARPFMAPTIIAKRKSWIEIMTSGSKAILNGSTTFANVLELTTKRAAGDVRATIASITSPPLSPITILLRKLKRANPQLKVGGRLIGQLAAQLNSSHPPSLTGVSTKPLNDTGVLIATLDGRVEKE